MLEEVGQVSDWLRDERRCRISRRAGLAEDLKKKQARREKNLRVWAHRQLPNLNLKTVDELAKKFPQFVIPTNSLFFGYLRWVPRTLSVSTFRETLLMYVQEIGYYEEPLLKESKQLHDEIVALISHMIENSLETEVLTHRLIELELIRINESKIKPPLREYARLALLQQLESRVILLDDLVEGRGNDPTKLESLLWSKLVASLVDETPLVQVLTTHDTAL